MFNGMHFKTLTLGNDLQVLAISDPRFVKSSAALAVMAGSMQNPDEHLGLAHFLEHMLFLGTEKFPNVGDYEDFLNKNGGGHNAYTSIDHTNYFFDVSHPAFEGALERFSRFFVCPTFDSQYVSREINAVHSEHEKNLKDDGRREYRFLQLITDPSHPFSKFATGDRNTLSGANRDVVMDFYKKHYSSNLMRLVLMSSLEIEKLEDLAQKHFADIPNVHLDMPVFGDQLFPADMTKRIHQVETVRDQDILKLSFAMPDDLPYWESKPTSFLAHLIGEEGEGSLLSLLKERSLALGLETSTWWRMFHVKVHLTDEGKGKINEIIKTVFSYFELLKKEGLKEYIFNERQVMAQTELDFMEPNSSMGRASSYSASMLYFPVDDFLSHYYLFHKYSPQEFNQFLAFLNVDNLQVTFLTKEKIEGEREIYYGIDYQSKSLEPGLIEELKKVSILPELKYPEPNPYIPDNLSMISEPGIGAPEEEVYKKFSTLYSQTDTDLKIPKASISLSFISDKIKGDPRKYLLAKLFAKMKKEELNEWGYAARLAGINFNISHGYNTLTLDVSGFSQHLPHLLKDLIHDEKHGRKINHAEVKTETFESIRKKIKKALMNRSYDAAYQQLLSENSHFFATASVHYLDYLPFLDDVTIEEVNDFAKEFFSQVSIRSFTYGNIEGGSLKPVVDFFFEHFHASGFTEADVEKFENKFPVLPEKNLALRFGGENNNNAQLTFYRGTDWSIANQAYFDIIAKLIEQPFFTELRTHQQLGYVVAAFTSSSNGFCGVGSLIQSQTHEALDIFNRSDSFLKEFFGKVKEQMKEEDVEVIKAALLSELRMTPSSLRERLGRFTLMAGTYHGDFQFLGKLANRIEKISLDDLKSFIDKHLMLKGGVPTLTLLFNGSDSQTNALPEGFEEVTDYQSFIKKVEKIQPYKNSKNLK